MCVCVCVCVCVCNQLCFTIMTVVYMTSDLQLEFRNQPHHEVNLSKEMTIHHEYSMRNVLQPAKPSWNLE